MLKAKQLRNFACKVCKRKAGLLKAVEGQTAKELCLQSFQEKTGILKDVEGQTAKKLRLQGLQEKGRTFTGCLRPNRQETLPARFARGKSDF